MNNFSIALPIVLRSEIGRYFVISDGSFFLNIGVILTSFQVVGTLLCAKEKLNRSLRGLDNGFESCFRSLLLMPSGPAAFPTESELKFRLLRVDLCELIPVSVYF